MHATLCDLITDLVQNAIEADATYIQLKIEETPEQFKIVISDNGKGMDAETLEKARDPFYTDGKKHRHRKVGLGLPFLIQTAEATNGTAQIDSQPGIGTTVSFTLDARHVDLPEFGCFTSAAVMLMAYGFEGELEIERQRKGKGYTLRRSELQDALGDLTDLESLALMKEFIQGNEKEVTGF